jgi:CRP-like cAMP-binding protein
MKNNTIKPEDLTQSCEKFCEALTQDEVVTFLRFSTGRTLEANSIIADVGEIGDSFFLVAKGDVLLFQDNDTNETEIEIGKIKSGGLVGEMSFFDRLPRTVRLKAGKTGTTLVVITRPMYRRLTIEHPFIAVNLLEFIILSLDQLVRNTSKNISSMHKTMTGVGYR